MSMNVFYGIEKIDRDLKGSVATLGVFDGLHIAHMKIVKRAIEKALEINRESILITFEPHPRNVLNHYSLPMLTAPEEKIELLEKENLDNMLFLKVDKTFLKTTADKFIKRFLIDRIGVSNVIVGYDYHFGSGREGSPDLLKEKGKLLGFGTEIFDPIEMDGETVRSSLIRKLLLNGEIRRANRYLGRKYAFSGEVIRGSGRGKTLGFPTINITPLSNVKLIPKRGVYFTSVIINHSSYYGICNIGTRPTFGESEITIEIHLFLEDYLDFYGKEVFVNFLERIRDENDFESMDDLKKQIELDKKYCLNKIDTVKVENGGII